MSARTQYVSKLKACRRKKGALFKVVVFIFLVLTGLGFIFFHNSFFVSLLRGSSFVSPVSSLFSSTGRNVLGLESLLEKQKISFSEVSEIDSETVRIELKEGQEVFISSKKSLDEQISSLQLILSRLTIEGKGFSKLDLRFERPVIVFVL